MVLDRIGIEWGLKILCDMISIPTINPYGENFDKFVKYIVGILKEIGMEIDVIEVPRDLVESICKDCAKYGRYIVVGRIGSGKPVIQFNGHYDVVPPGSGWNYDPFKPVIVEEKIFGRGAVDMKGGIAAILTAIKIFASIYKDFRGCVEIVFVPDEEIGGLSGTGYLVRYVSKPDYVIIAEPSGSTNLWIGHKGLLWGYVEVFGKQTHGSTPWRGVNAFEYMIKIASRFLDVYRNMIEKRKSLYNYSDSEGAKPSIAIGGEVVGSTKINIVPGYYAFSFDRRIIPEENLEDVEKEIKEIIERITKDFLDVKTKISIVNKLKPALTKIDSLLVKNMEKAIEKITSFKPKPVICIGGLDLHYYTEQGIDAIAYGPGPDEMAHSANEYVSINEIEITAKVYLELLKSMLISTQ